MSQMNTFFSINIERKTCSLIVTRKQFLELSLLKHSTHTWKTLENPVNGSPDVNAVGPRPELGGSSMIHVVLLPHQTFINKAGGSCDVVCVLRELDCFSRWRYIHSKKEVSKWT